MSSVKLKAMATSLVLISGVLTQAAPAFALEAGDILLRFRGIGLFPTGDSGGISPDLLTSGLEAQPMGVPELDITYMVTDNIGVELIAATAPHDIEGTGGISSLDKVAEAWLLPPTLLAQWHFMPDQTIRPYIGAGINYTIMYAEDADSSLETALGGSTDVSLDNSFGWAVQAGVDIELDERWFVNVDVKYVAISSDVTLTTGATKRTADVDINPIIVGVGIGYRF